MEEHNIIAGIGTLNIPKEIVFEILKRVGAKSLMRFRCVSKYFCSLISESSFIEAHDKNLATQLLVHCEDFNPKVRMNNFISGDEDLSNSLIQYLDEPCFRNLHDMQSSIKGLVCLWNYTGDIAICNPFIKEHVFLPKLQPIEKVLQSISNFLFGFDPTTKKHKVLMGYMAYFEVSKVQMKYWIFTIGVDKSWREISDWLNICNISTMHNYVCIDGVIYLENKTRPNIAVFSIVGDEKLIRMISFPSELISPNEIISPGKVITVVEIKGQVALIVNDDFDHDIHKLSMYILNSTCETETWVKHVIKLPSLLTKKSLFTTNGEGEIVWIPDNTASHMFFYEVGLKEWREVGIHMNYQQKRPKDADSVLIYLVESIWPLR